MSELWTIGLPILVVDVANPVLLAAVILAVTTPRPFTTSLAVIAGHSTAYLAVGLLVIFGLTDLVVDFAQPLIDYVNDPQPLDFVVSGLAGLALLAVALRWRTAPPAPSQKPPEPANAGVFPAFLFGAVINFIGIPFAVPYFGFLSQIMKLADSQALAPLVLYNLGYAAVFLLVPLSVAIFGKAVLPLLQKINAVVEKYSAYLMPVMLAILGLALLIDAGLYFATGKGLI